MKEELLSRVKREMAIILEQTTLDRIEKQRSTFMNYFDFLVSLHRLPTFQATDMYEKETGDFILRLSWTFLFIRLRGSYAEEYFQN